MSSFNIKSLRERLLLKELIMDQEIKDTVYYTPYDGQEKYDLEWTETHQLLNNLKITISTIVEAKVRKYPITAYNSWLIEKDKYDFLINQKHDQKLYICFHPDGYQIWDLNQVEEPIWREENHQINDEGQNQRTKLVGDLNSTEAVITKKVIDIYDYYDRAKNIFEKRTKK